MVRIPIVQESEASGRTKELYEEIAEMFGLGFVPDVFKLVSTREDLLERMLEHYKVLFFVGVLPREVKEMIATVVSATNSCEY